jgi:hypothetical protein
VKAIPNSLRPDPHRKSAHREVGEVAFRTAIHRSVESRDPKRPGSFESAYRETPLRPGLIVQASDREYVVTESGAIVNRQQKVRKARPLSKANQEAK